MRRARDHEDSEGLRDYGVAAQILLDLGVRDMILLHNTHWTIVGLDGYAAPRGRSAADLG